MDQVTRAVERITDSDDFICVPGVPVFDEHDEHDADGNVVRKFDRAYLERLARNINNRASGGSLGAIGPGHTIPDQFDDKGNVVVAVPEEFQPPIWGYWANARVGPFGPEKRTALIVDYYVKREVEERQKDGTTKLIDGVKAVKDSYPRPSVELWPASKIIDWIALLRRTPQRDIGQMVYSKDRATVVAVPIPKEKRRYDRLKKPLEAFESDRRLCYAMEFPHMADNVPDAMAPDKDFSDKVMRCMKESYPHLDRMHSEHATRYDAENKAADDDLDGVLGSKPEANAAAGASVPVLDGGKKPGEVDKEEQIRMSRESAEIERRNLEKRVAQLEAREKEQVRRFARAEAERSVAHLETLGFRLVRTEEVDHLAGSADGKIPGLPRDKWPVRLDYIRKHYRQDGEPVAQDSSTYIPLAADAPNRGPGGGPGPRRFSREEVEKAERACERDPRTNYEAELDKIAAARK